MAIKYRVTLIDGSIQEFDQEIVSVEKIEVKFAFEGVDYDSFDEVLRLQVGSKEIGSDPKKELADIVPKPAIAPKETILKLILTTTV